MRRASAACLPQQARPLMPRKAQFREDRAMPFSRAAPTYDPAVLAILQQAYDEACRELGVDPNPVDRSLLQETREALAAAIMDLAATGLRDPSVLRAQRWKR